jgi:ribosomal protein S21
LLGQDESIDQALRRLQSLARSENCGQPFFTFAWKKSPRYFEKPSTVRRRRRWFAALHRWDPGLLEYSGWHTPFMFWRQSRPPEDKLLLRRCQLVFCRFRGYAALVDRRPDEPGRVVVDQYYGQPFDPGRFFIRSGPPCLGICHACSRGIWLDEMVWENDGPDDLVLCERCYAAVRSQLMATGAADHRCPDDLLEVFCSKGPEAD